MNPETLIQNKIVQYLHSKSIVVWRMGDTRNAIGFPDLLAIDPRNGKFVGIEVKTETGVVSAIQSRVHDIIRRHKGIVIVARKVEDVEAYFYDGPN